MVFIRPPSNGASLERENRLYPRQEYWDVYWNIPKRQDTIFPIMKKLPIWFVLMSHTFPRQMQYYIRRS